MILIFSCKGDSTTDKVISYLSLASVEFIRIDSEDFLYNGVYLDMGKHEMVIGKNVITVDKIKTVWFRKNGTNTRFNLFDVFPFDIAIQIEKEIRVVKEFFFEQFKEKKWLNFYEFGRVNKLSVLKKAKEIGLSIPETFIVSSLADLEKTTHDDVITKSTYEPIFLKRNEGLYVSYTQEVVNQNYSKTFSPSLVQKKITKKIELRVFFIEGRFYSMAIFSQSHPQTSLDFRRYLYDKPNRCVPYNLPMEIKQKLNTLMSLIGLNSGSIDLMVDKEDNYYFLEVNPVGQLGMVERPCNYGLHKIIAQTLIDFEMNEN